MKKNYLSHLFLILLFWTAFLPTSVNAVPGCEVTCSGGTCRAYQHGAVCYCGDNGTPRCENGEGLRALDVVRDEFGNVIATGDEINEFFYKLEQQSKPKITIVK
jgi:hypothetical protein